MADAQEAPVFSSAPPERIELMGGRSLVRWTADRAAAASRSITESLEHLRPWMAWAQEAPTEAAQRIERVHIQCDERNVRSARVPEKLGYTFQGVYVPDDGVCAGRSTQAWVTERDDWIANRGRNPS